MGLGAIQEDIEVVLGPLGRIAIRVYGKSPLPCHGGDGLPRSLLGDDRGAAALFCLVGQGLQGLIRHDHEVAVK